MTSVRKSPQVARPIRCTIVCFMLLSFVISASAILISMYYIASIRDQRLERLRGSRLVVHDQKFSDRPAGSCAIKRCRAKSLSIIKCPPKKALFSGGLDAGKGEATTRI